MTHDEVAEAYRQYGHLVLRRCRRILRGDGGAEDALQEVFVRLWRYGEAFAAAESKGLWLFRVDDRCCFDHLSSRRARAWVPPGDDADLPGGTRGDGPGGGGRGVALAVLHRFDDPVK